VKDRRGRIPGSRRMAPCEDLVKLRVRDVCHGQAVASRTSVLQQKTHRPVQFEITEPAHQQRSVPHGDSAARPRSKAPVHLCVS